MGNFVWQYTFVLFLQVVDGMIDGAGDDGRDLLDDVFRFFLHTFLDPIQDDGNEGIHIESGDEVLVFLTDVLSF